VTVSTFEPDSVDAVMGTTIPEATITETVVRKKAVPTFGYYELGKKEYFIPAPLYSEVLARDEASPLTRKGDKEFAKFLKAFIKDHPDVIYESYRSKSSYGAGSGLGGYWAMPYTYGGAKGTDDNTARLATVLRACKTVLSVVDPEHKLRVQYTDDKTSSWMDDNVRVPNRPAKTISDLEEAINIMSGFTVHEAWHSQHTRSLMDSEFIKWLKESGWNSACFNIIEDVREEELGLEETPGYREYLNYVMEFLWDDKFETPTEWPDEPNKRLACAYLWMREPDRAADLLIGDSFAEPKAWIEGFIRRYVEGVNADPRGEVAKSYALELIEWLEIPEEEKQPTPSTMTLTACGYADGEEAMGDKEQETLQEALESETEEVGDKNWLSVFGEMRRTTHGWGSGDAMHSAVIRRPRVTQPSRFRPSKGGLIAKAKAVLSLKKSQAQADTRLMKNGELDEDELYRFFAKDMRIFKDATIETLPDAAVYLLIDMSGSMGSPEHGGGPAYYATAIAQVMVEALSTHPNIKVKVLGHTGENNDNREGGAFYRIWEQGDPLNRLSLLYTIQYVENFDSWAIAWAGEMLKKEAADQRMLIVLSDGVPGASSYGGAMAMDHVRSVTDRLERQGVPVVQVAVDAGLSPEQQSRMFKHWVGIPEDESLAGILKNMTDILRKVGTRQ
jgi:hypothetical protein